MAKIRGIKPEFWTADGTVEMSVPARLLYIGLWNYACDNGHLRDKPRQIKTRILPGDDVKVDELLEEMVGAGQIVRADGWITIPDLTAHQKPHKRWWQTCEKPGCVVPDGASHAPSNRGATVAQPLQNGGATVSNGCATADGDGDGDGDVKVREARKRATTIPSDFTPNDTNRRVAKERGVNLDALVPQFMDHHAAKGSTMKDWHLALNTWIRRERPTQPTATASRLPRASELELPPDGLSVEEYDAWDRAQRAKRAGQ